MALDDMLRALEEEGRTQQEDILKSAKRQAADIVKSAKAQTAQIEAVYIDRANKTIEDETAKILTEARRHVERGVSRAKDLLIEDVFAGAAAGLKETRASRGYDIVFAGLAGDAMRKADGNVVVHIDSRDRKLAETVLRKAGYVCEVLEDIVTEGGLIVSAEEGKVVIDNTVESRAARAQVFMKSAVAARLFGGVS